MTSRYSSATTARGDDALARTNIHKKGASMKTITIIKPAYSTFALIALAWCALSPTAQAVTPAPDGGYANGNTAEGTQALSSLTTGFGNTADGFRALFTVTSGVGNTATGYGTLTNATGNGNTGNGFGTLFADTTGGFNTATGVGALTMNQAGNNNTADGSEALFNNTSDRNTATGFRALYANSTGSSNTANGFQALMNSSTGKANVAIGWTALFNNTTGGSNTASGGATLFNNTTGILNTASGASALSNNTTGSNNIAFGYLAGANLTTGDNNIDIGNQGIAGEANTIRIGDVSVHNGTYVAGIYGFGNALSVNLPVYVNPNGQLGTIASSQRFKRDIAPMGRSSEAILLLQPVTFHYKRDLDAQGVPQFGLVAEEVAKVDPDLVVHDGTGAIYSVRYEAVNAMLLNEFIKDHRRVEEQQRQIDKLTTELKEQAALLQTVSAQVDLMKTAPRTVAENR
ncbi:MAG TPA: tail fiber domain-containing protein [Chthoniobacterales bacterium]|nr:tail fiber domain-containing protein [Chthoniobacterales bacterium]